MKLLDGYIGHFHSTGLHMRSLLRLYEVTLSNRTDLGLVVSAPSEPSVEREKECHSHTSHTGARRHTHEHAHTPRETNTQRNTHTDKHTVRVLPQASAWQNLKGGGQGTE